MGHGDDIERRGAVEIRATGSRLGGYAAVFASPSHDLGGFIETIQPGAFSRCLAKSPDVFAMFDHDKRSILGRTTSKTLELWEDVRGLSFLVDVADTTIGRDVLESVGRGDITGASFGFRALKDKWEYPESGTPQRILIDVELLDVTITPNPAYPDTSVALRSLTSPRTEWQSALRARELEIERAR